MNWEKVKQGLLSCKHNKSQNKLLFIIIIIDNRGLNARWCLTPFLLLLPTAAYLGQRGLTPAGLSHTTAQCHLIIHGEAVLFCLNHPSFRTPGSLSFCCRFIFLLSFASLQIVLLSFWQKYDDLDKTAVSRFWLTGKSVSATEVLRPERSSLTVTLTRARIKLVTQKST